MDSTEMLLHMPTVTLPSHANLAPPLEQAGAKLGIW